MPEQKNVNGVNVSELFNTINAIKSDKSARTSKEGRKILGGKAIPRWVWVLGAAGVIYWAYTAFNKDKGDIQSPHSVPPAQPGSTGSH